jgi:hypothetical protein
MLDWQHRVTYIFVKNIFVKNIFVKNRELKAETKDEIELDYPDIVPGFHLRKII